jgi:hypothetical protein
MSDYFRVSLKMFNYFFCIGHSLTCKSPGAKKKAFPSDEKTGCSGRRRYATFLFAGAQKQLRVFSDGGFPRLRRRKSNRARPVVVQ